MFDKVTITYRGATYEIGRGHAFYGIWTVGGSRAHPLQWWPETADGWSAAWSRFVAIEAPGTIVPVGRRTPPIAQVPVAAGTVPLADRSAAAGQGPGPAPSGPAAPGTAVLEDRTAPFAPQTPFAPGSPFGQAAAAGTPRTPRTPRVGTRTGTIAAASLLAAGVIAGVAGLFPHYLAGSSLTAQAYEVVPHAIYLATWTASIVLIMLGGARLRPGALLAAGLSAVTLGVFFADLGTAVAGGSQVGGWGLWLSLAGWLACAAGSVLALLTRPAHGGAPARFLSRPRGAAIGPVVLVVLAGLGTAAAFAPSWDSYVLRTATGLTRTLTAGNAFSNPGLVITGDVIAMVALAAVVIAAAFWRPVRHGAMLLTGAVVAMVAQAISAVIEVAAGASPGQFGLTPGQASQLGLTIASGVTPDFWIFCGFLLVLVVSAAWMLFTPHDGAGLIPARPAVPGVSPWSPATPAAATMPAATVPVATPATATVPAATMPADTMPGTVEPDRVRPDGQDGAVASADGQDGSVG